MKVVNLKKKIGASLLVAGMITPGAAHAAGVNVNLLVDPSFEDVETGPQGSYATQPLNSWSDGFQVGATYRYEQDIDKPDAGDNDPLLNPPSPGLRYFTANYPDHDNCNTGSGSACTDPHYTLAHPIHNLGLDTVFPGEVSQNVDVSTGDAADEIAAGTAEYLLSGWFGGYNANASNAILSLDFLNSFGGFIDSTFVVGDGFEWNEQSVTGTIPVGTFTVVASVYSQDAGTGAAFVDLAKFIINPEDTLVGDFDGNGVVNGADFLLWQRDMSVGNLADWEAGYGLGGLSATNAVPEPGTCILVSMGLLLATGTRRKK